ncbi:terminase small subunit [Aeromonas phage vB_AhyS-A18P4]|uniref:Terminase small subunit n=1 Tax=Aeromonas phage vB_AhyS-A18P4 TaxID=2608321 RepID=A0A5J6T2M1_9CAUD|nr:terminase small subunit [Aeromonas phage vB_AhyS-A18P4]QFG04468.1 hypothetical protein [Aeromonas phage vB_AhyS-A18P4]
MAIEKNGGAERARRSNQQDAQSNAMIFDGCTQSQLCTIFKMDRRTMSAKLIQGNVKPCGTRAGFPIYYIHEVAPHVVKPLYDIETYISRMHHNDLPPLLSKEFWNGKKARQDYELREGNLWETEQVQEKVSAMLKDIRMTILLFRDGLSRDTVLTDEQHNKLQLMIDGLLNDMAGNLAKMFNGRVDEQEADDDEI